MKLRVGIVRHLTSTPKPKAPKKPKALPAHVPHPHQTVNRKPTYSALKPPPPPTKLQKVAARTINPVRARRSAKKMPKPMPMSNPAPAKRATKSLKQPGIGRNGRR